MKIIRQGLVLVLIAGMAQAGEKMRIISYLPDQGIVCVDQGAGKTDRPFSSFTDAEQNQITGWLTDREFENSGLRVTIEEKKTSVESNPNSPNRGRRSGEVNYISYVITLENRAKVRFKDVSVNACIFYETHEKWFSSKEENILQERSERIDLSPGEIRTVETKAVTIRDEKITYAAHILERSSSTFSTPGGPGGSVTVGGGDTLSGPPTTYIRDRLKGLYLCVSKQDWNGKPIIHEFEDGNPPGKENWADYKQQEDQSSDKKVSAAKVGISGKGPGAWGEISKKDTGIWNEEDLREAIQRARHGSYMAALLVAEYYHKQGDQEETKEWADKVRTLVKRGSKEQRENAAKKVAERLAVLDQAEATTVSR